MQCSFNKVSKLTYVNLNLDDLHTSLIHTSLALSSGKVQSIIRCIIYCGGCVHAGWGYNTVQVIIKQKVQLKTTLVGLAELDGFHTRFKVGKGCAIDKFYGKLFQILMPSGKKDCLYTLLLVNGTRYRISMRNINKAVYYAKHHHCLGLYMTLL